MVSTVWREVWVRLFSRRLVRMTVLHNNSHIKIRHFRERGKSTTVSCRMMKVRAQRRKLLVTLYMRSVYNTFITPYTDTSSH